MSSYSRTMGSRGTQKRPILVEADLRTVLHLNGSVSYILKAEGDRGGLLKHPIRLVGLQFSRASWTVGHRLTQSLLDLVNNFLNNILEVSEVEIWVGRIVDSTDTSIAVTREDHFKSVIWIIWSLPVFRITPQYTKRLTENTTANKVQILSVRFRSRSQLKKLFTWNGNFVNFVDETH